MSKKKLTKAQISYQFFQECGVLEELVSPTGAVSATEYSKLLDVAMYYRDVAVASLGEKAHKMLTISTDSQVAIDEPTVFNSSIIFTEDVVFEKDVTIGGTMTAINRVDVERTVHKDKVLSGRRDLALAFFGLKR